MAYGESSDIIRKVLDSFFYNIVGLLKACQVGTGFADSRDADKKPSCR